MKHIFNLNESCSYFKSPVGSEFNVISGLSVVKRSSLPVGLTEGRDGFLLHHVRRCNRKDKQMPQ